MPPPVEPTPELYRTLIDQVPAVVYVALATDPAEIVYISPRCQELLGCPAEACLRDPSVIAARIHRDDAERVLGHWRASAARGGTFSCEYRYLHPDGRTIWLVDQARSEPGGNGEPPVVHGVLQDITDWRRARSDLHESEARFEALVENLPAVVYEMGPDDERRAIYVSAHVEQVLGYGRDEWLDQPDIWSELLHPDDREIELAAHDRHNETGEPWLRRYRLIAADGRVVWVRDQAVLVPGRDGRPPRWQGVMMDITAHKQAEDQLREARDQLEFRVAARTTALADANELMGIEIAERRRAEAEATEAEERLRVLIENLPAVVYACDMGDPLTNVYTSPQVERLLGFTADQWTNSSLWSERLHPHDRERVLATIEQSKRRGEPYNVEYRLLDRAGRVVWVLDRGSLIRREADGRAAVFQGVMLPIAARKAAEDKATEAEARYRMLAEKGPGIAYLWYRTVTDPVARYSYLSPRIEELLGYPIERWQAEGFWRSILHPDDAPRAIEEEVEIEASGREWSLDYRVIAADGRVVWLHDEGKLVERDADGEPAVFLGTFFDITPWKEVEERLRADLDVYRAVAEGMPGIPWTEVGDPATRRTRMTYIGPQVERITGYRPEELLAEPGHFARMLHPDDRDRVLAAATDSEQNGTPWDEEYRIVTRGGRTIRLRSRAELSTDRDGRPVWHGVAVEVAEPIASPPARLEPAAARDDLA